MNIEKIREARCFDGTSVAVDDIVDIKLGYISDIALCAKLGRKRTVTARIVSFEETLMVIDTSTAYNAKQIDLDYTRIEDIKRIEERPVIEPVAPDWSGL